jgi:ribonuclease J
LTENLAGNSPGAVPTADQPSHFTRGDVVDISDAGTVLRPKNINQSNQNGRSRRSLRRGRNYTKKVGSASTKSPAEPKPRLKKNRLPRRTSRGLTEPNEEASKPAVIRRAPTKNLRIIPLGGSKEIGEKNMLVFEYDNDIIVIDAGIQFPDASMPGIDYIICDTTYLEENRDRVRAFVVTHGHEDHIGGFPFIWPKFQVPIYTAPLTAGLIKAKFEEYGIKGYEFRIIQPNDRFQIGAFTIEPVRMTHSIPDILGLAITCPVGLIYHATDWKFDFTPAFGESTDFAKLAELADRGVLALLSDSTNVLEPGYTMSEQVVSQALEGIFAKAKGRIIVSSFSSRIDRIQHVVTACANTGRRLALAGRSMERNANIAMELGYLKAPKGVITDIKTINSLPDDKIVVMCTGSQGEEYSALVRMSNGEHRHIKIKPGDTVVVSAKPIPGNERGIDQTINNLYRLGAEVITNKELDIHSSGHAHREELKLLISLIKPRYLIPIHGDYRRFVEHAKLATSAGVKYENCLILENGYVAEFDEKGGRMSEERVPVGQVLIDGSGVGDVGEIVLRDRQTMAKDGVFVIILTVDRKTGRLLSSPDIISRGFVYMKESEELISGARALSRKLHGQFIAKHPINWDALKKALRDDMSDFLFQKTQRSPMVITAVIQV